MLCKQIQSSCLGSSKQGGTHAGKKSVGLNSFILEKPNCLTLYTVLPVTDMKFPGPVDKLLKERMPDVYSEPCQLEAAFLTKYSILDV